MTNKMLRVPLSDGTFKEYPLIYAAGDWAVVDRFYDYIVIHVPTGRGLPFYSLSRSKLTKCVQKLKNVRITGTTVPKDVQRRIRKIMAQDLVMEEKA